MKRLNLLLLICLLILPSIGFATTSDDPSEVVSESEAEADYEETADSTEAESLSSETNEDCLVLPYISSFDEFRAEPREDGTEGHSLYMRFKVDYDYTVEISGLLYVDKNIERTDKTRVRIMPNERDNHITYTGSNYPDPQDGQLTRYVSFTKADAYREARKIYDRLKLNKLQARPRDVAPACSPAYIYDADLLIPPNVKSDFESDRTQYEHMKYHKYMTCYKSIQYNGSQYESPISNHEGYELEMGRYRDSGTVAAAYSNRVVLFANADGAIYVNKLDESNLFVFDRFNASPLISLTHLPGQIGVESRGLDSSVCARKLYEVNLEEAATYNDFDSVKPFRTITAGQEDAANSLLVTEANDTVNLHKYQTNDQGKRIKSLLPKSSLFAKNTKKFAANETVGFLISSMAIFQTKTGITRCQAVLRKPSVITHLLYVNSELAPDYSIRDQVIKIDSDRMAEPDDIVYWSSCERVVSFYGFLYTVHHYKANIFEEPSKWHLLSEKLFDYPIEAVHADGDVFYFLVKATTVYKMTVDSSTSCSKLRFIHNKTTMHLSEFLGFQPKQFHTEGRYFSAERGGWQPSWNTYKNQHLSQQVIDFEPPDEPTTKSPSQQPQFKSDESLVWMYVGLSLLGLLVLVVVVLFIYMLPKRNGHYSRR